jgi:hypothetical protein
MRVSWADYPSSGRWAKDERPSEKKEMGLCVARCPG